MSQFEKGEINSTSPEIKTKMGKKPHMNTLSRQDGQLISYVRSLSTKTDRDLSNSMLYIDGEWFVYLVGR